MKTTKAVPLLSIQSDTCDATDFLYTNTTWLLRLQPGHLVPPRRGKYVTPLMADREIFGRKRDDIK